MHCPVVEMTTRSKLSCLSWNKYAKNHIASSDYEGIVTVWDVDTRQVMTVLINWTAIVIFTADVIQKPCFYLRPSYLSTLVLFTSVAIVI